MNYNQLMAKNQPQKMFSRLKTLMNWTHHFQYSEYMGSQNICLTLIVFDEEHRKAVCGKPHARFDEGGLAKQGGNGLAIEAPADERDGNG